MYESTVRHLQLPILRSDEDLCVFWLLRGSESVIEYREALRSRVRDGPLRGRALKKTVLTESSSCVSTSCMYVMSRASEMGSLHVFDDP